MFVCSRRAIGSANPKLINALRQLGSSSGSRFPEVLSRAEVPKRYPQFRSKKTLENMAHAHQGPPYYLVAGRAWYAVADIDAWLAKQKISTGIMTSPQNDNALPVPRKRGRPSKMALYNAKRMEA